MIVVCKFLLGIPLTVWSCMTYAAWIGVQWFIERDLIDAIFRATMFIAMAGMILVAGTPRAANYFGARAFEPRVGPMHVNFTTATSYGALQYLPDVYIGMDQTLVEYKFDKWTVTRILMKFIGRDTEFALAQQSAAASGFTQGRMFLDSGASTTLINDSSMLQNIKPLKWPKKIWG
jgi:hypothetical protein